MGGKLDEDELIQRWTIVGDELAQVAGKRGATRLGFALLLKFYEQRGRFPRGRSEFPDEAIAYVGRQVGVQAGELGPYELDSRTVEYHRAQIRSFLGFRECTVGDAEKLTAFLVEGICQQERRAGRVREALLRCCRADGIEQPSAGRVARIVSSALRQAENALITKVLSRIEPDVAGRMIALNDGVIWPHRDTRNWPHAATWL